MVDQAIQKGVTRLKKLHCRLARGGRRHAHPVGYAALPALTLLECGVAKNDPVILKAEAYIRAALPKMDDTYELALSVLFLDKLGDKKDEAMIQGLSLRLIAGQSGTGGWGYKCPNLENKQSHALLKILKDISPPKKAARAADKPAAPVRIVIPPDVSDLAKYAVLQDFSQIVLQDPPDKGQDPITPTTDNSDTQFAILALWTAQRHGVPMDRTLQLIANRFKTSQDSTGSWGYTYKYGGGTGESAPMDCCGLLGLAVGHGRAANEGQEDAIKDTKIVNGFAAVNKFIGAPIGRYRDVPLQNLYFLWSWERVGVLYDLPTLVDKDWFRWGAEGIIANQAPTGEWLEGGGYPAATPVANTCFALLFLRRTNLVADLTAALKLNPADLAKAITAKIAPPPPPPAPTPPPPPVKAARTNANAGCCGAAACAGGSRGAPAPVPAPPPAPPPESGNWGLWLGLGLGGFALLLLAGGGAVLLIHFNNQKKEAQRRKEAKCKKGDGKRIAKPASSQAPPAKKPQGKTGIRP